MEIMEDMEKGQGNCNCFLNHGSHGSTVTAKSNPHSDTVTNGFTVASVASVVK